jgi:hypothetical protein
MIQREVKWFMPIEAWENEPILLFSACDSEYLEYAIALIRSADLFSPGFLFVLHLVNPKQKSLDRLQRLAKTIKGIRLAVSFENIDLTALNNEQKKAYFASARFPQLAKLLRQYQRPIFSLDADSLIVNPIDLNFSDKTDAEIIIVRRDLNNQVSEKVSVANGSIWFKPIESVCKFLDNVALEIDERLQNRNLEWFVDQVIFSQQIQKMSKEVKFFNLKGKYADWYFTEKSIVWAGKGNRKVMDMRFFLLYALLSDDVNLRAFAIQLWSNLCAVKPDFSKSRWLSERLGLASKSVQRVALFIPRLDLPWKRASDSSVPPPLLVEDVLDLRLHWKKFAVRLANVIEHAGLPVDVIELPAWEIDRQKIEASGAALALVPHRCQLDFDEGATPVLFYMQEFFRWVFVFDECGWSAASSVYPVNLESLPETDHNCFDTYRQRLLAGSLDSKFAQSSRKTFAKLIVEGSIPVSRNRLGLSTKRPYIFFPLQIPHDESIKYFSDFTEYEVVESLVAWAKKQNIALVMKPHPANRKSMIPFEALIDDINVFWSEANVYDLIEHATGVYTLNSGVGFEALLHLKPVVTFGRVEYDCVTFHATPINLNLAWEYCLKADINSLEKNYRRFINWFLNDYAIDLSRPEECLTRLEQLASDIVTQVNTKGINQAS